MPIFAPTKNLMRVSAAKAAEIRNWKEGQYLERNSGHTLEELMHRAAADRFKLAVGFLSVADHLCSQARPQYRVAVGRYYYAMYHAMRAAAFVHHEGDDHERHSELPGKSPSDLPNAATLANSLKSAREQRNHADYDPYPKSDAAWRIMATALKADAHGLVTAIKSYLQTKGCRYV